MGGGAHEQVLIAFNKPWGVLSRFTADGSPWRTLAEFGLPPGVYPLGRLDADSEGLLLLGDEKGLSERLLHPRANHPRTYWVQVERGPDAAALARLRGGVMIAGGATRPCRVRPIAPELPPRDPPIRFRKTVPTVWLEIELTEGRNRQVRKMTAAVGHPTLRLVRVAIGGFWLAALGVGEWRLLGPVERDLVGRC